MTEQNSEHEARDAIRKAFPVDAGLSAEKTRDLYECLREAEARPPRRGWSAWAIAASVTAVLVAGLGGAALLAARPVPATPSPAVASVKPPVARPAAKAQLVPALALKAIGATQAEVLHFTSTADAAFGPNAGHSTEEMWFDPKSGSGRLVRKNMRGGTVLETTTIVSDGKTADVITRRAGGEAVTTSASRLDWRSLDKLSAYRTMLESGAATVTARGKSDGVATYRLRAVVPGFGGTEFKLVMEAEVRASDYLPLSYTCAFRSADGHKTLLLSARSFSKFERVRTRDLPAGWFTPRSSGRAGDDGAVRGSASI